MSRSHILDRNSKELIDHYFDVKPYLYSAGKYYPTFDKYQKKLVRLDCCPEGINTIDIEKIFNDKILKLEYLSSIKAGDNILVKINGRKQIYTITNNDLDKMLEVLHELRDIHNYIDITSALPFHQNPPDYVIRNAKKSLDQHIIGKYPNYEKLKKACARFWREHGAVHCKEDNIWIDTSTFDILRKIFRSDFVPRGSTILIPTPTFGHYLDILKPSKKYPHMADYDRDYKLFCYPVEKNGKLNISKLEVDLLDRKRNNLPIPKVMLFMNPCNPTGLTYNDDELRQIAQLCHKYKIFMVSDEIFLDTVDPATQSMSVAAYMNKDQYIAISGVGKSYGSPGARVSFVCGYEPNLNKIFMPYLFLSGTVSSFSAKMAEDILSPNGKDAHEKVEYLMKAYQSFQNNVNLVSAKVEEINRLLNEKHGSVDHEYLILNIPDSTTVVSINFSDELKRIGFLGNKVKTSLDVANILCNEAKVATVPGEAFLISRDELMVRMNIADDVKLEQAFDNIINAVKRSKILDGISTKDPIKMGIETKSDSKEYYRKLLDKDNSSSKLSADEINFIKGR